MTTHAARASHETEHLGEGKNLGVEVVKVMLLRNGVVVVVVDRVSVRVNRGRGFVGMMK